MNDLDKIVTTIANSNRYNRRGAGKFLRLRDAAIQLILFYTGMRPGECLNLKWSDINFQTRMISVNPMHNKERNAMPVVITKPALQGLKYYKEEMDQMNLKSEYAFPSLWTWRPMTVDAMGKRFRLILKEAGLNMVSWYSDLGVAHHTYNMYSYRRTFGTKAYIKTNDTLAVMKLLRLTTPSAVPKYVIFNDEQRIDLADKIFPS